ncbi:ABC transporter substrate-binding protein [Pararhodospirillum oryzae]|uniref:ABC transporter substrate-binding protein n=1 Tax=Pararhodospirillum oryzae TaxID=478448 RepID=A0A512H7T5_9PROT|nr:ABC transporter substrate-binding protein [Pararhodospirillum oryzae]GEO81488.1 ABC transporter substrate-binding protein [Pararhodospirillum oryzae]
MRLIAPIAAALGLAVTATTLPLDPVHAADQTRHVAITQIVEHPALDAARQGIQDALSEDGWVVGDNLEWTYESAQGSVSTASQIAKKFVGLAPDVIVAIATPSAQTAAAVAGSIPVVFSAVTDPVGAKLVRSMEEPGGPITGTSDMLPLDRHLAMIRSIMPGAKRLGVMYNSGEANSVTLVARLKELAGAAGFTIVESTAPRSSDVLDAARFLVGKVDAIYVPTDNTVISSLEAVLKVGIDNKIPVFTGDTASVERGSVAAVGFDYHDLGLQTGHIVSRILAGTDPRTIPVETVQKNDLYINLGMAERMGLTLPEDMIKNAAVVIR